MQLQIIQETDKGGETKTRQFRATCLGFLSANKLWTGGEKADDRPQTYGGALIRPIYLVVAGNEGLKPFLANIRRGNKANIIGEQRGKYENSTIEVMRSVNYSETHMQVEDGIQMTTLYQRILLNRDGDMVDPEGVRCVAMPPRAWVDAQLESLERQQENELMAWASWAGILAGGNEGSAISLDSDTIKRFACRAAFTMGFIDSRTSNPIMSNLTYWTHAVFEGLKRGLFRLPFTAETQDPWAWGRYQGNSGWHTGEAGFFGYGLHELGFEEPMLINVNHQALDALLSNTITTYLTFKEQY